MSEITDTLRALLSMAMLEYQNIVSFPWWLFIRELWERTVKGKKLNNNNNSNNNNNYNNRREGNNS